MVRPRTAGTQTRLRSALIGQLIRKDLKVKYQGSTLGFLWSLANPLLILVVYTFVFAVVFRSQIPYFGLFLMSGMLLWNFFTMGVSGATTSVVANAGLVKKVPFAHESLPLAAIGFAGVQVALQYVALVLAFFVVGMPPLRPELVLILPALVVALVATVGLGLFTAAATVRLRDTQHLVEVGLFAWMWLTPIIYPATFVHEQINNPLVEKLYYLNPLAGPTIAMQRALYGVVHYPEGTANAGELLLPSADISYYFQALALSGVTATVFIIAGVWLFKRRSADFAEDL